MLDNKMIKLISLSDFILFRDKLTSLKNDLSNQKTGKQTLNVLDYFIIYELGLDYSNVYYNNLTRYSLAYDNNKLGVYFILPSSYYEMRSNLSRVKKQLNSIKFKHIRSLRDDKKAKYFSKAVQAYKSNPTDFSLYRNALIAFRDAFLIRDSGYIKHAVNNVFRFFYAENLYIKPFKKMIEFLNSEQILSVSEIKKIAGIESFTYDSQIYQRAFLQLRTYRVRWHSDIVDALCYSMCVDLVSKLPQYRLRFITSDAPFRSFYNNTQLDNTTDSFVRNAYMMALEKYILEKNNWDLSQSFSFIEEQLETLNEICSEPDYRSSLKTRLRTKIREEFRDNMTDHIKKILHTRTPDLFFSLPFLEN